MNYSKTGMQLTEQFEGVKLTAYQDQGSRWTIGYGHTLGVKLGDICTLQQAADWLLEDIHWAVRVVNAMVRRCLSQGEFDALVDFTFNLGSGSFAHSQLLALVNRGDFAAAANEFDKWDHAGGRVVAGLLRRREAERQEFNEGVPMNELTNNCHYCEKPSVEYVDVPQPDRIKFRVHFCQEHFDMFAKRARNFAQMNEWMAKLSGPGNN